MKEVKIGRSKDNEWVIDNDKISRHHCRCYMQDGKYFIEDVGSTNGVWVDNVKLNVSTPVEITEASSVSIAGLIVPGKDLLARLNVHSDPVPPVDDSQLAQCQALEQKYDGLFDRYKKNVQLLLDVAKLEKHPYKLLFESDEAKMSYMVNRYQQQMTEAVQILKLLAKTSQTDLITFQHEMDVMARLYTEAPQKQKEQCADIRLRVYDKMNLLKHQVLGDVKNALSELENYYQQTFSSYYESSATSHPMWNKVDNKNIIATSDIYCGQQDIRIPFFDQTLEIHFLQFFPLLKRGNLLVRYGYAEEQKANALVNNILARILAGSQSGNVQVQVMDVKDYGGTSNIFKMLDKHVFSIVSQGEKVKSQLMALNTYVMNVVQNMLQGSDYTLEAYNAGKENQEPYHVVVFKDFPYGMTPEVASLIRPIIANGTNAGVHFIFMVNDEMVNCSEDCLKVSRILHLDEPSGLNAKCIDLSKKDEDVRVTTTYARLSEEQLHSVVQYVNSGFEVRKEEVLRLTDYMIPREEWWTRQSASRSDIPFGMSTNKQIQKLSITQESGQNSALVIGIPGSGKSVFLHVLIANAMLNYSPKELQMYLLDFSGVEFDVYARHNLPHARVIAPEAEREFGLSVLRDIKEEGVKRMNLCRENGVQNIVELKQKLPKEEFPRLLVIIDEFQKIFEIENDAISREANSIIHTIIQEYRKFGINLILATQKLPAKSIVPYDLIANRVVFKADPNDFNNLIRWPHSMPSPRLLTGSCVYTNEPGSEVSNYFTKSFYINATGDLETLLDEVARFGQEHREMLSNKPMLVFRGKDLPEYEKRVVASQHQEERDIPTEIGVYLGQSISMAPTHIFAPLTRNSNNNILIVGGKPDVAKGIAYYALLSEIQAHSNKAANVVLLNFMTPEDPMNALFQTPICTAVTEKCKTFSEPKEEILEWLQDLKDKIDERKKGIDDGNRNIFINIFDFQRGHVFDFVGNGRVSECGNLLMYILQNGPMVGVFTTLHVDCSPNLARLGMLSTVMRLFAHRIALQMPEKDSRNVLDDASASRLWVENRPTTKYRALYFDNVNNSITKFKPYSYGRL